MGTKTKKGTKGEAIEYYSRKQALRHLQINLPNFIRLCLWKGIYPSEPHCRKIAGRGNTTPKIYYKRKDINLLLHEPVLGKLREIRIHQMKIKKAKEKKDKDKLFRLMKSKPKYTLHHMVKELYPDIRTALANIDDSLKNIFVFSELPKMTQFNSAYIPLCKKLKLEFFNYCITQQALRKCFISVKGFYMEAELLGIPVLWSMPHQHTATILPGHADYRLMANQVEFDCTMLACVLKHLYTIESLAYPPKFDTSAISADINGEWSHADLLASLSFPMMRTDAEHVQIVSNLTKLSEIDDECALALEKEERVFALQTLFKGKKVFLSREVPREVFCFLIRCCGGSVSWDRVVGHGATFDESAEDIAYQVVDRPLADISMRVSRFYVQPQYVFDSINAGRLLPVKDYMPGTELPSHLSPFVDYSKGYVPPEYRYLRGEISAEQLYDNVGEGEGEGEAGDEEEAVEEIVYESENEEDDEEDQEEEDEEEDGGEEEDTRMKVEAPKPKRSSAPRKTKETLMKQINDNKLIKMKEMNIPKKQRNLYNKMKYAEKKKVSDVAKLTEKRKQANKNRSATSKKK